MSKFKELQDVIVLNMLFNDKRIDAGGKYLGQNIFGGNKGLHRVRVNGVELNFPLDRLVDAQEYWDKKNKEKKE